jgi:prepilin-type N-terminal cleavage/methylation domain-containing protein
MKHITTFRRVGVDRSRGFTLVELLFVIGIIVLLMGILVPSLQKAYEQTLRVRCGTNVREVAKACKTYMLQDRLHRNTVGGLMPCGEADDSALDLGTGNIMGLRILLERDFIEPKVLVCPSARRWLDHDVPEVEPDPDESKEQLVGDRFVNSAGRRTCSYAYLSMYADDQDAKKVRRQSTIHNLPSSMVVVGDSNPRVEYDSDWNGSLTANNEENSENHEGKGQNVGLLNGSVEWITSPTAAGDDIYTSAKGANSKERSTIEDVLLIP